MDQVSAYSEPLTSHAAG